jgi:hypothetical protein
MIVLLVLSLRVLKYLIDVMKGGSPSNLGYRLGREVVL